MKYTTLFLASVLILYGLGAAVYALFGVDLLALALPVPALYRAALSLAGVAAAWLAFWLIAFRPTKFLS